MCLRRDAYKRIPILFASALALLVGCQNRTKLIVGSKSSTDQSIVGEIIAQHLEHRLGQAVERRPNLNGTASAYQLLQGGEVSLYPEYTGSIVSEVLLEPPVTDPPQVFERARGEVRRTGRVELLDPLGFDNHVVMVIRTDDPRAARTQTLDDAAKAGEGGDAKNGWKIAVSYAFQQTADISLLTKYQLPMAAAVRGMESASLFPALQKGEISMIAARATDGMLASTDKAASAWKILEDNRHVFTPQQSAILVRQDVLMSLPGLRPALEELSGKFTAARVRSLTAAVDVDQHKVKDVAADFLKSAGLK